MRVSLLLSSYDEGFVALVFFVVVVVGFKYYRLFLMMGSALLSFHDDGFSATVFS